MMIKKLLIEALKIFAITSILWALIKLIRWRPYLGFTVIAILGFLIIVSGILLIYGKKHIHNNKQSTLDMSQEFKSPMQSYEQKPIEENFKPTYQPYQSSEDKLQDIPAEGALGFVNNFVFIASNIAAIVLLSQDILRIAIIIGAWLSEVIFWLGIKVFIKMSRNIEQINKKLK